MFTNQLRSKSLIFIKETVQQKRINSAIAVVIVLATVLTACGGAATTAQDWEPSENCPNVGGTLKFARTADVADWYYNLDNPSIWA